MDTTNYEFEIFDLISKCLDKDETILMDKHYDFRLPNGFKKLKWEGNTVIEIKYRLTYDSMPYIKSFLGSPNEKNFVIIFIDQNVLPNILRSEQKKEHSIKIIKYAQLIADIKKKSEINTQISETEKEITYKKYHEEKNENIKEKLKNTLKNNKISIFVGAGVSKSAGVVDWNGLLKRLCEKRKINNTILNNQYNNLTQGRYIVDKYKDSLKKERKIPRQFYADIRSILYKEREHKTNPFKLINSIVALTNKCRIESVISYNYDNLLEQKIKGKCQSVYDKSRPTDNETLQIYHVHGFVPETGRYSQIVLGEKEYHKVYQEVYNWGNVEQLHALCRSSCLFIGLSMTDPNLRRLMDISNDGTEVPRVHYAFLCKSEFDVPIMESMMYGFGVNCVWYDDYDDLPVLLNELIS